MGNCSVARDLQIERGDKADYEKLCRYHYRDAGVGVFVAILKRLSTKLDTKELGGLLPQTAKQIERLVSLQRPGVPIKAEAKSFANTLVFFLNDDQQQTVLQALSLAPEPPEKLTRAGRAVAGLVHLAQFCIENQVRA